MKHTIPHVYLDRDVTAERLARFGNAQSSEQRDALTWLRFRSAAHGFEIDGVVFGIWFAFIAVGYAIMGPLDLGESFGQVSSYAAPLWMKLGLYVVVGLVLPALYVTQLRKVFIHVGRERATAKVWLAFYEDELAIRRAAKGRAADRWRKVHPIDWGS